MGLKITKRLKTRDALVLLRDCPDTFREIGEALDVKPYDRITFGQRVDMTELVTIADLVLKPWELIRPDDCKPINTKSVIVTSSVISARWPKVIRSYGFTSSASPTSRNVSGKSCKSTSASRVFSRLVIFSPIRSTF